MKFEEVYALRNASKLTMEEAARMLGMPERHLRRYIEHYEEDGLNDKRLARAAHNAAPVAGVVNLMNLLLLNTRQ